MDIRIEDSYEALSDVAAAIIIDQVMNKPDSILGLTCGASPLGLYKRLVEAKKSGVDFSRIRTINVDEYIGLAPDNPDSHYSYMRENLFDGLELRPEQSILPNGMAVDVLSECADYSKRIVDMGGIDMMVLGIGANAHIGFNEPGDSFIPETHVVELLYATRRDNAKFFKNPEAMPFWAISMGIRDIMFARSLILLVSGSSKTVALEKAVGDITPRAPASILQLHHNVTIIADKPAASRLVREGKIKASN